MNKDEFWEIIDSVNKNFADKDREFRRSQVVEKLRQLSTEEILDWHLILTEYEDAAYRHDLWVASVALGASCSDDGFLYFRAWLISCGKEVYMKAMQDPNSLAAVPLAGEKPNFERFGYAAVEAYDEKLCLTDFESKNALFKELDNHALDQQTVKDIHAELPKDGDIRADRPMWTFPNLFPGICKTQEPKDIAELLAAGDIVYGDVYKGSRFTQYVFRFTPGNIANFIGSHMDAQKIVVTDGLDRLILNTVGRFVDQCPDKTLLEQIKKILIPIQLGNAEAQPFFCPTRDEVDAYCEQKDFME